MRIVPTTRSASRSKPERSASSTNARRAEAHLVAVHDEGALVGGVETRDDLGERGLARPVLADEPVHRAGGDGEVDSLEYRRAPEGLADAPQLDRELRGAGGCRFSRHRSPGPFAGE